MIYQLTATENDRVVVLVVTLDMDAVHRVAAIATGLQGWSFSDLTLVTWVDGQSSSAPYGA